MPSVSVCGGLELELNRSVSGLRMYLNVYSLCLFPNDPYTDDIDVHIEINEDEYVFTARLLRGGQKVLIPDNGMQFILDTLLEEQIITIRVGRFKSTIDPTNFAPLFEELMMIPTCSI